jgi:hypothetical protein
VKDDLIVSKAFVRTLGRLGIVDRSYFLIWGINWVFPHGIPHGQGKK